MTTDPEIVRYCREIDARLDLVLSDLRDINSRMISVAERFDVVNRRLDHTDDRLSRIERHLLSAKLSGGPLTKD
jgi:hypothetical protein